MTLVSWQSAFWGLFSIAGNTFIQDPGNFAKFTSIPGRILRLSPYVCVLDTLWISFCYIRDLLRGHEASAIAVSILRARELEYPREDLGRHDFIQEGVKAGVPTAFFAFTQLLKLSGMQGIPFTTTSAWCYFMSYLILEITKFLAGFHSSPQLTVLGELNTASMTVDSRTLRTWFRRGCTQTFGMLLGNFVWWISSLQSYLMNTQIHPTGNSNKVYIAQVIGQQAVWAFIAPPQMPDGDDERLFPRSGYGWPYIVLVPFVVVFGCLLGGVLEDSYEIGYLAAMAPVSVLVFAGRFVGWLVLQAQQRADWYGVQSMKQWMSWWVTLVGFVIALTWYAKCWDGSRTVKPPWTDALG